jgi:hypothetical protein
MRYFAIVFLILVVVCGVYAYKYYHPSLMIETPNVTEHYVGKVSLNSGQSVRLLILKHCFEGIADSESDGVVKAANLAASKGLSIRDLGRHQVNINGLNERLVWGTRVKMSGLKDFVSQQMKISAEAGDTIVIYTTGHGSAGGSLMILGPRKEVFKALVEAAEENNQETLWWQSSCYACAGLPSIDSLTPKQKTLFSMIASSPANETSTWHDQTPLMEKLFVGLATNDPNLDSNRDGIVTAGEISQFLNKDEVFASTPDEPIFGFWNYANLIPIFNRYGIPYNTPDNYIPLPR